MSGRNIDALFESGRVFDVAEARRLADAAVTSQEVWFGDENHQRFFYETCPMIQVAEFVDDQITGIEFFGRTDRVDGRLFIEDANGAIYVEVTSAIDGYQSDMIMQLLEEHSFASMTTTYKPVGTKKTGRQIEEVEKITSQSSRDTKILLPNLVRALDKKRELSFTNPLYVGAWLVVVFDDHVGSRDWDENRIRYEPIFERAVTLSKIAQSNFSMLYFVGLAGYYLSGRKL